MRLLPRLKSAVVVAVILALFPIIVVAACLLSRDEAWED